MNPIFQYQTLFQQLISKKNNQVSIQVKKGQCLKWFDDVQFCLEMWIDRRSEIKNVWEGDIEIVLGVYEKKKKLTSVRLNDHDLNYGPEKWYKIKLSNGKMLNLAGGPKFATGSLFHFSCYVET